MYIAGFDKSAHIDVAKGISSITKHVKFRRNLVVLCIGTDRSTGDALGPLVGTYLMEQSFPYPIYGTIDNPIHATNLQAKLNEIKMQYPGAYMIVVDAALEKIENVGRIRIRSGSIKPGSALYKDLPEVGDLAISAIVNCAGCMETYVLNDTRLSVTMQLAKVISNGLLDWSMKFTKNLHFQRLGGV